MDASERSLVRRRRALESLVMFSDVYKNAPVLVTGHTGFKGGWLSIWLSRLRARVTGYSLPPPTSPSLFEACALAGRLRHVEGDVRDRGRILAALRQHKPAFIFHLAAKTLVRESYARPLETFDVNVLGTISLLDAIREWNQPAIVIIVSTDKCYENLETGRPFSEDDRLGGHDPYSASKAAMEIAVASYARSFFASGSDDGCGVQIATVRAGNVIGGGDWSADRLVPDAVRAFSAGRTLEVRNERSVRPWQHVLEPVSGYLSIGAKLASEGGSVPASWNFGPVEIESQSVAELAGAFAAAWGGAEWAVAHQPGAPREAQLLRLSIQKAWRDLGWHPVWDFPTAVKRTADWYQNFYSGSRNADASYQDCLNDIAAYETAAREAKLLWTS
jgi:CDP-glucose 4,6-dehydratase